MSKTSICNEALAACGELPLTSYENDTSPRADLCRSVYEETRQEVLAAFPWSFAASRVELDTVDETPAFEFDYTFQLPADFLSMNECSLDAYGYAYKLEGDSILTNESEVIIAYTRDEEDTSAFSPLFRRALVLYLAHKMCYALTKETKREEKLLEQFELTLGRAMTKDSQHGSLRSFRVESLSNRTLSNSSVARGSYWVDD